MKLDIDKLAGRLSIPVRTLKRWIRQGRIPVYREGESCVFRRASLERWASAHNLAFSPRREEKAADSEQPPLENLLPVMKRGGVFYDLDPADVDAALYQAAEKVPDLSPSDREELVEGLREREQMTSTGIGRGVAFPHPRSPMAGMIEKPTITTCFLKHPLDFSAVDDRPVFVLFLMLSPSIKSHLHLLSRLSFCVRDETFIDFLNQRPDADALFARIGEVEDRLDAADV